jgi:DNA-binding beta-propeller fold protein YncE
VVVKFRRGLKAGFSGLLSVLALAQASLSPADTLIVANKSDATVDLVDLTTGISARTLTTGDGPHEVAVSSDGRRAVITNYGGSQAGNSLTVIDVVAGAVTAVIDLGKYSRPHGVLFLPDNRRVLVTAEGAAALVVVDIDEQRVETAIATNQDVSHMVVYHAASGVGLVSNIGSGSVTRLDVAGDTWMGQQKVGQGTEGIALSANGRDLWLANREDDKVLLLDARTLAQRARIEVAGFPIRVEMSADGRQVLVTSARAGTLTVIDAARQQVVEVVKLDRAAERGQPGIPSAMLEGDSMPIGIEVAPDGRRVWISHAGANQVQELETGSWKQLRLLSAGREPDGMGYSALAVTP